MRQLAYNLLICLSLLMVSQVQASDSTQRSTTPGILNQLTINGHTVNPQSVRRVEFSGPLYEVRLRNGDILYSDASGERLLVGQMYVNAPSGLVNMTEQNAQKERLEQLNAMARASTVNYSGQGHEIGQITVFTDTTCPYCKMLHQDINTLIGAGISVRYISFPRAGVNSPAARQLAQVLCSQTPQDALTQAFSGQQLEAEVSQDCHDAVRRGFQLGQQLGIQGTPTIVLPSGEMGEGYMPANQLIQAVKRTEGLKP